MNDNLYEYVNNSPLVNVDYWGYQAVPVGQSQMSMNLPAQPPMSMNPPISPTQGGCPPSNNTNNGPLGGGLPSNNSGNHSSTPEQCIDDCQNERASCDADCIANFEGENQRFCFQQCLAQEFWCIGNCGD